MENILAIKFDSNDKLLLMITVAAKIKLSCMLEKCIHQ